MSEIKKESTLHQQGELSSCISQYEFDNTTENNNNQEDVDKIDVINLKDFMKLDLPKPQMLLDPIIAEGSLSMLYAYRGIGKSFFAMQLALAVAKGGKFLRWKALRASKVLYVDGEMPSTTLQERFAKLEKSMIKDYSTNYNYTDNLLILSADLQKFPSIDIGKKEIQNKIINLVSEQEIKFIILDNLSSLTTIDEINAQEWIPIQEWLLYLRKKGIAVMFVHHSGKRGGQRGTSKREDILDVVMGLHPTSKNEKKSTNNKLSEDIDEDNFEVEKFGGKCKVVFEKNRNLSDKHKVTNFDIKLIDLEDGSTTWIDVYALIKELYDEGQSGREIAETLGLSKTTVYNILNIK